MPPRGRFFLTGENVQITTYHTTIHLSPDSIRGLLVDHRSWTVSVLVAGTEPVVLPFTDGGEMDEWLAGPVGSAVAAAAEGTLVMEQLFAELAEENARVERDGTLQLSVDCVRAEAHAVQSIIETKLEELASYADLQLKWRWLDKG